MTSTHTPSVGAWNHYVAVFDGTNLNMYVNGSLYSSSLAAAPADTTGVPVKMGPHYSSPSIYGYINGKLDDVRIYNRALSTSDIAQLYNVAGSAPATYSISVTASPAAAGTVTGGGTFSSGSSVTVLASAAAGYSFANWTENSSVVSSSSSYTFNAGANRSLVANFSPIPCNFSLSASSVSVGANGGTGSINVTAGSTCAWTAVANNTWITITSGTSGSGNGSANYSVTANTSTSPRTGTITVAGQTFTVSQAAAVANYTISLVASPAGSGTVSGGGTFASGSSVTVVASPAAGYSFFNWTESGTVVSTSSSYTFAAGANRTLTANFVPIPCTYALSPTSASFGSAAASWSFSVTAGSTCTWTATTTNAWIHTSSTGTGNGTVNYNVDANTASLSRLGAITVAGQTFAVTQLGVSCIYTLSAPTASYNSAAASGSVTLTAPGGCNWTATTGSTWIHTSSTGTGTGTISYSVDSNPSTTSRQGTITAGGQTFTVTQSGNIAPVANAGPNRTVGVGTVVSFSGASSSDSDGTVTGYNWSFGDLTSASGISVSHSYLSAGTYTVNLTVTDNLGATGTGTATVTVTNPVCPLTVSLTSPVSGSTVSNTITLAATASTCATRVEFYCDSQTAPIGTSTSVPFSALCDTTTMPNGTHSFYSKAYDAAGNSANSATVSVTVKNSSATAPPGQILWAKPFGGTGAENLYAVATDTSGNIFMGGDSSDFGVNFATLTKLSPAGDLLWSLTFAGTAMVQGSTIFALTTDSSGNVFVTGYFSGTMDFGNGTIPIVSTGYTDIYVAKFSPAGLCLWARSFGSNTPDNPGWEAGHGIALDRSGNVIVAGNFLGTVNFGGGPLTSAGGQDIFVLKLSPTGGYVWAKRAGSSNSDSATGVAVDASNNIFVTGFFYGSADFGGGSVASHGGQDAFLVKYDANGNYQWENNFGGYYYNAGQSVAVDSHGNPVVTGWYEYTADFGGGPVTSAGEKDIFIAKYSATGGYLWSHTPGSSMISESGYGVTCDQNDNAILTGCFANTVDFGSGPMTSNGSFDAFVAKYSSSGVNTWSQHFGSSTDQERGTAIASDASGNVIAVGRFWTSFTLSNGTTLTSAGNWDGFAVKIAP
jgi:hypothetical protein